MMSCLVNPIINMKFRMIYPTQFWKNRGWCWVYHIFDHRFQLRLATARLGSAPVLHVNRWLLHRFKAGWLEDQPVVDHVYTRLSMRNASHIISCHVISYHINICTHDPVSRVHGRPHMVWGVTLDPRPPRPQGGYIDKYIHKYIYILYIFAHTHSCMYACIYIYILLRYIRRYMYIYIHISYLCIYIYTYIYIYIYTSIYIHTYIHIYIHIYTHIHICMHAYIHTYIYTYIYAYMHIHLYIYIHMYIHSERERERICYICIISYIYIYTV